MSSFHEPASRPSIDLPLASVSKRCAEQLARAARNPSSIYLPHPDGGFVLWAADTPGGASPPLEMRFWWEHDEPGWKLQQDGYHYLIPLRKDDRTIALARLGPYREQKLGRLRTLAIDRAVPDVIFALQEARRNDAAEGKRERKSIERSLDELLAIWKGDLKGLICEAIRAEVLADVVVVRPDGQLAIAGAERSSPISVAILEDQLEKMDEQPTPHSAYRTLCAIADATDARAEHTFGHSQRVASVSEAVIRRFTNDEALWHSVGMAARLHDVGASFCGTQALRKVRLDDGERAIVKRHPEIGHRIALTLGIDPAVAEGIRSHHERWDGQGYPDGISGAAIPLVAQVIAIAEVFDALTTARPWRGQLPLRDALATIKAGAGTQFNPIIVDTFLGMHETASP
jgi:HD-GYP domain-containing protein (c-di-GMP phosphodiesterase class II)